MSEKIKKEILKLSDDGYDLLKKFLEDKAENNTIILGQQYQIWYTKANIVVKEVLPNRYDEFVECYKCSKRKEISYANYSMNDYFLNISISRGGIVLFDSKDAALRKFINQLNIVKSISENIDNVLFNIKNNIEFEVLDNELDSSKKLLKKGFLRSAGALCGVVLEKHFSTVLNNHNLNIGKKDPCISDYNDFFKQEGIYDTVQWRYIQHLGDIRNLCDHNKSREPQKDEVEELIIGTEKIIKTVF